MWADAKGESSSHLKSMLCGEPGPIRRKSAPPKVESFSFDLRISCKFRPVRETERGNAALNNRNYMVYSAAD
jgi:hypothetical protein